jgi:hypothetical protein
VLFEALKNFSNQMLKTTGTHAKIILTFRFGGSSKPLQLADVI